MSQNNNHTTTVNQTQLLESVLRNYIKKVDAKEYDGTILERVIEFAYDSQMHESQMYNYSELAFMLLIAFTDKDISGRIEEKTGQDNYREIVEMLTRLVKFTKSLYSDRSEAELYLYSIDEAQSAKALTVIDMPESRVQSLIDKYTLKVKAIRQ